MKTFKTCLVVLCLVVCLSWTISAKEIATKTNNNNDNNDNIKDKTNVVQRLIRSIFKSSNMASNMANNNNNKEHDIEVLASGGGSRSMITSAFWSNKLNLGKYPRAGLSGGAWNVLARGSSKLSDSQLIAKWTQYLERNSKHELGGYFNRRSGLSQRNYFQYSTIWDAFVTNAIKKPLGIEKYDMLVGDSILIGVKMPPVDNGWWTRYWKNAARNWVTGGKEKHEILEIKKVAKNKITWTLHFPETGLKATVVGHMLWYHTVGEDFTTREPKTMPLSLRTAALFTSAAFTGTSNTVNTDYNHGIRGEISIEQDGKKHTFKNAQFFDLGVRCNIPFPAFTQSPKRYYVSLDSSDSKTTGESLDNCKPYWEHFGWTMEAVDTVRVDGKTIDSKSSNKNNGIKIYKLTKNGVASTHIINLPIATIDDQMNLDGIHTMAADNVKSGSLGSALANPAQWLGHKVVTQVGKGYMPQSFFIKQFDIAQKAVSEYYNALTERKALPKTL